MILSVKNSKRIVAALLAAMLSPLAVADVSHDAHEMKEATKHAAKRTGEVTKEAAHGFAHGVKQAAHGVAEATRNGYHAAKRAIHKA